MDNVKYGGISDSVYVSGSMYVHSDECEHTIAALRAQLAAAEAENEAHRKAQAAVYLVLGTGNPDRDTWPDAIRSLRARLDDGRVERANPVYVVIRDGWENAGKRGMVLGPPVFVEQNWTPVLWDDEDDPDFHKTAGLAAADGGE